MMKHWCIRFGLWLATRGGWAPCALPHLPDDSQIDLARHIVRDVAARYPEAPGPAKSREALRALLNLRPEAKTRDLNLLIELALHE